MMTKLCLFIILIIGKKLIGHIEVHGISYLTFMLVHFIKHASLSRNNRLEFTQSLNVWNQDFSRSQFISRLVSLPFQVACLL